jgi:hypothetical protein
MSAAVWFLKRESAQDVDITVHINQDEDDAPVRIRCPLCEWQPDKRSRWCCVRTPSPEGFFGGCGTVWDTFSTRGRCPGCQHQWRWTSCLRCNGWSLHEDWYEEQRDGLI